MEAKELKKYMFSINNMKNFMVFCILLLSVNFLRLFFFSKESESDQKQKLEMWHIVSFLTLTMCQCAYFHLVCLFVFKRDGEINKAGQNDGGTNS